ncbi:mitochondrial dicarboxylate transporter [Sodiomyces alkalinus F11]|uniref:Mitochondrial dicarboxylate transporter n=1 Tax=Sodiomyces alkalinus (strain CBS 110278 / VKM F-3762 / F11) TaxID=1314773 RepID=A0A3N2Q7C2_SODAK|nr:mitochondrial dicarboxylate transporter [Sodiomyces alkalinus F11]ROT42683.1 mitochondrial dicarboxylate transporter [Sodiomyces alkalinus F11]
MSSKTKSKEPFWLGYVASGVSFISSARFGFSRSRDSMFRAMYRFAARDGIHSLWSGLSASILRQSTYSTARFGLYNIVAQKARQHTGQDKLSAAWTITCAGVAGGFAGLVGNPTEVVLVRMCADGAKPAAERFAYPNALIGLYRVGRDEGVSAFARGLSANIVRSLLMSKYSAAKQYLISGAGLKDDVRTHFLSSLVAGTVATTICAPADVLKSRIQSASAALGSRSSIIQIIRTSLREEGPRFLMKGWTPAWLRLTPHTVLTFVFMEQLRTLTQLSLVVPKETIKV